MNEILLNPGPVNVSERVRAALAKGDACHREEEVAESLAGTRRVLLQLFDPHEAFEAVFFTGSGTAALEAAVIAAPGKGGKLCVVENGVYGERISKIARANGIEVAALKGEWTKRPDLGALEKLLTSDPAVDSVAMVHHETTTGLLNPVREVGALAKTHGKRFVLDTVSGLGGEEIDLDLWGVDFAASTANKCLCGLPGISFVLARKAALEQTRENPVRSLYLDVRGNLEAQRNSCGAFTPAVQVLWALEEALHELAEETIEMRIARFRKVAGRLREGITALGLNLLLKEAALLSNTITAFELPAKIAYETLHDELKKKGFVIYAGQGPLADKVFRVANMGHVSDTAYERFLEELGAILR